MTTNPPEIIRYVDGEPMLSADALALLFGIEAADVVAGVPFSPEWLKAGRRRCGEARAHTGKSDILSVLSYWARRDLGCVLEFREDEGGSPP